MHNVLLVTYPFPPSGGIGVPRALAWARYLPEHNCRVVVLTASHPATPVYDPELIKLVPKETIVVRAFNPEPPFAWRDKIWKRLNPPHRNSGNAVVGPTRTPSVFAAIKRWLREAAQTVLFPDIQTLWTPFAIRAGSRIIEEYGIDTIIVNAPPFSSLKIGIALKKRYPHIKLVSDFRDDWVGYYLHQFDSPELQKVQRVRSLERAAVESSDFVSTVTETWVEGIRKRYPDQPPSKFLLTPNGFDPDLFRNFVSRPHSTGKMVVTYFGTIHNNKIYSPANYIAAIEGLPEEVRLQIETRFIGRITPDAESIFERRRANLLRFGFMPKVEGLKLLEESDLLLLIATNPGSHAGKLFEYLATGKPILALSPPDGEIGKVLCQTASGWCVDPWKTDEIRTAILRCFENFTRDSKLIAPDKSAIARYSWPSVIDSFVVNAGINSSQGNVPESEPSIDAPIG